MNNYAPDSVSSEVEPQATWSEALDELQLMKGQTVSQITAISGPVPSAVCSNVGKLRFELAGEGRYQRVSATVDMTEIIIDSDRFEGAEVTAGYVAFKLGGVHLSIARWVPAVRRYGDAEYSVTAEG
ncbi:MAG: hypothetical protein JJE23_01640 [Thermoleophilia bacterium]|nr:hypothetical protein [Thermoleophilia bacterium]